jgi:hypothetical protein
MIWLVLLKIALSLGLVVGAISLYRAIVISYLKHEYQAAWEANTPFWWDIADGVTLILILAMLICLCVGLTLGIF